MGRKILFITTDQQRYDSLGCNGGTIARTPTVDALARDGVNYRRAYNQNTVCMPARSTMLTGQYVRTHGVVANGVPLPADAPSVAAYLHDKAGYRTALLGQGALRARLRPAACSGRRTRMAVDGLTGPYRGFEHAELAVHVPAFGDRRVAALRPLADRQPRPRGDEGFLAAARGGARRRHRRARDAHQPDPARVVPHRLGRRSHDRVPRLAARRRRLVRLDVVPRSAPSVGPARERTASLQLARPRPAARSPREQGGRSNASSRRSPRTGSRSWEGTFVNAEGGPGTYRPQNVSDDNIREINAMTHIMNELDRRGVRPRAAPRRGARLGRRHRRLLHDRPRRAAGRLRPDLQGAVPHRRADAAADGVAARAVGRRRGRSGDHRAGRPARPRADVLRDRGRAAARLDAGRAAADRARLRPRARAVRVGLAVPRLRHAPALDLPRRLAVHRVRAVDGRRAERARGVLRRDRHVRRRHRADQLGRRTTAPKASCTTSRTTRTSGRTAGTTRRARRCAKTSSPTSTTACRPNARC